jgi:hypothetical protein
MNRSIFLVLALLAAPAFAQITLRQSDAVEIPIGNIYDAADLATGTWTAETALTIEDEHVLLTKCTAAGDCAAAAAKTETTNCAHITGGAYECDLNTSDTDTVGTLRVNIAMSGTTPVWATFTVVTQAVFDACCASSSAPITPAGVVDEWETQSQADPTGFRVNVYEAENTDFTNYVETRTLAAAMYFDPATAEVTVAADGLDGVLIAEPADVPAWGSSSLVAAISYLTAWFRNEVQQTATKKTLRNDADSAALVECGVSDDSTTFQVSECVAVP